MQKQIKQLITRILTLSLIISLMSSATDAKAAKKKIKLSSKSITIDIRESKTIKIKNIKAKNIKKLTVKSKKKKIATVKRLGAKKTSFKVTGKSTGNVKILVKLRLKGQKRTKKLVLKVNVTPVSNTSIPQTTTKTDTSAIPSETKIPQPTILTTGTPKESITPVLPTLTPKVSAKPTIKPSLTPTVKPTAVSTEATTETPKPTTTADATKEPIGPSVPPTNPVISVAPTTEPTANPVVSLSPTTEPTKKPTITSSPLPTSEIEETIKIDNVIVTDNRTLFITLSESCALTANDLVLKTKSTKQDSYGEALAIESIEKNDPFQYEVVLQDTTGNYIVNNGYVQVTVSNLSKVPMVAEDQYERENVTITKEWISRFSLEGTKYNVLMDLDDEDFIGNVQYEVLGNLPSGLYYDLKGSYLYLKGTPKEVGTYKCVLSITDEVGNNLVYNWTYLIGDANQLFASAKIDYETPGEELVSYINTIGGSGSYTYTKVEGNYDFTVSSNGEVKASFDNAGTYHLYVDVADAQNNSLKTRAEIVFQVADTYTISGTLTDLGKSNLQFKGSALQVYVIPQDPEIDNRYFRSEPMATLDSSISGFYIDVPAGIYDIQFKSRYGSVYKVIKDVEVKNQNVTMGTIELPLCQVTLEAPNKDNLYQIYWKNEEDILIGRNATFLVRPGTYSLHSDPDTSPVMASLYDYTATFTATDDSVHTVLTATPQNQRISSMQLGSTVEIELSGGAKKYMKFTPTETGTYRFYTTDIDKTVYFRVYLDNEYDYTDSRYLTLSNVTVICSANSQMNHSMTLQKGTTYYLGFNTAFNTDDDTFIFGMEKVE